MGGGGGGGERPILMSCSRPSLTGLLICLDWADLGLDLAGLGLDLGLGSTIYLSILESF